MLTSKTKAARGSWRGITGGGMRTRQGEAALRSKDTIQAVALQIFKRGRPCIVGKLVPLDGELVLAVVWRNQRGTQRAVSVPLSALAYAEAHGAQRFVLRDDRTHTMRCIDLAGMRRIGWVGVDGELYIRLADMTPMPWRSWPFAEQVISLDEGSEGQGESEATQLALALEGGVS